MSGDNEKAQETSMPNPFKLWENFYFGAEESMGGLLKKMSENKGFTNGIDLFLNSYLQYLKFQNEMTAAYIDNTPLSSKNDTTRLARLLVALENKFDRLEDDFTSELATIKQQTNDVLERLSAAKQSGTGSSKEFDQRISQTLDDLQNLIQRVDQLETNLKNLNSNATPEPVKKSTPAVKKSSKAATPKGSTD